MNSSNPLDDVALVIKPLEAWEGDAGVSVIAMVVNSSKCPILVRNPMAKHAYISVRFSDGGSEAERTIIGNQLLRRKDSYMFSGSYVVIPPGESRQCRIRLDELFRLTSRSVIVTSQIDVFVGASRTMVERTISSMESTIAPE
jgi:hypothetical protein